MYSRHFTKQTHLFLLKKQANTRSLIIQRNTVYDHEVKNTLKFDPYAEFKKVKLIPLSREKKMNPYVFPLSLGIIEEGMN